jgi:pimeloyl-ACP methyl ester carboxylesterase
MRRIIFLFVAGGVVRVTRLRIAALVGLAIMLLTACGSSSGDPANSTPNVIEGRFDVGDYKLYMRCEGSGSPTVVYLHGFIEQPPGGASSAGEIPSMLRDKHRICVYDRANAGKSDNVPGLRTGESSVRDLHRLLEEGGVEPPYVLLGASFGGLISDAYAATYPEEVVGMVLLDASFPEEITQEHYWPKEERLKYEDWGAYEEKIDQYDVYKYALQVTGKERDIPLTYLLATPLGEGWEGPPGWQAAVFDELDKFVNNFSPGVLKKVKSPHFMEQAVPEKIAKEVEMLIASISEQGAREGKGNRPEKEEVS